MDDLHLAWRKSSRSGDNGGNCVEVATNGTRVLVRDSKSPREWLIVDPADFQALVDSLK